MLGVKKNCIGEKNDESFQNFKAIDSRIIRPLDGSEFVVASCFINITDVFPKISTEEFKRRAEENLPKLEIFNIAHKRIGFQLFFIHKPFKMHLEEIEYTEDEEIENYLKKEEEIVLPYKPIQEEDDKDVESLFRFKICQLQKSNQTKITFSVFHTIADGRSAFTLMDYIRKIVNGETLEENHEKLPNFGGMERFENVDERFYNPPEAWNEIQKLSILPKIDPPYQYVMTRKIYDYQPISKFNRKNGLTVQSMLMAMFSRATRKYNNLPKETPLWNIVPVDSRYTPYATEEYKKRQFYLNASAVYVKTEGQSTLMEDIKHCMSQLKKNRSEDINQIVITGGLIDSKTLAFVPKGRFPDIHSQAAVNNSHIGKVNGTFPLFTLSPEPNNPYTFFCHCYHTDEKLFITFIRPINFDKSYMDCFKEEMDKIFIPENISKY